jgi:hypothetical protein
LNFEVDMVRKLLAALIYVAGLCVVLYVAYFVPYINPEEDESVSAINNWGLLVTGMALILVASVLWAVRFSSDASHNGEHGERLSNENE